MEPRFVTRDSFIVMGFLTSITPENESSKTYELIWKNFENFHETIKPLSTDLHYYGITFNTEELNVFEYLAGMAVKDILDGALEISEDLLIRQIPSASYAVFESQVYAIGQTYQHIFAEWFPESLYKPGGPAPVFEQYPPQGHEKSPVLIHVPIEKKGGV